MSEKLEIKVDEEADIDTNFADRMYEIEAKIRDLEPNEEINIVRVE